jgi:hypothetical protein
MWLSCVGNNRVYSSLTVSLQVLSHRARPLALPELAMAMIMIRCPATGHAAFTGIETDASCVNFIPPINARLKCPCCGDTHVWSILDAELTASDESSVHGILPEWTSRLKKLDSAT